MGKRIILIIIVAVTFLFYYQPVIAQTGFETSPDTKHPELKVMRGSISKQVLINDTSFTWYAANQKYYYPDSALINTFKNNSNLYFIVFGGTWCEDTQVIIPKFFKLQEMSGLPEDHIAIFGVNREYKSLGYVAEAMAVKNVPTIIVMKDGKELGRVVEYGKTGMWDKELAEIINQQK